MSIARHVGGIAMLKPSAARLTVVHPDGNGLFAGDGDGVGVGLGLGVGLGVGDAVALWGEQPAPTSNASTRTRRENMR